MMDGFRDTFKIPDLRKRILFTLALLSVYRLGCYVPVPGVDGQALQQFFAGLPNTLFGIADLFAGGAFSNMTIFGLGIMPYISVSIILELLASLIPFFRNLLRGGGAEGRRKLTRYTRYGTVGLCLFQSAAIAAWLSNPANFNDVAVVRNPGILFMVTTIITLTTGTVFLMWLGEQITEKGIGNGISLIITAGILSRMPVAIHYITLMLKDGSLSMFTLVLLIPLMVAVVAAAILLNESERRIPVQYAKRVVGRRVYGGQSTYLPIKLNQGGVIPLIFALAILQFPATIMQVSHSRTVQRVAEWLSPTSPSGMVLYAVLTVFFCYFYAALIFNPDNIADDLKKYGGFVAGIRPGKPTAAYLERILNRLTLPGSLMLAAIALMPYLLHRYIRNYLVASEFGGIGLLIVVSVLIETIRQIEAHLLVRHYEGFIRKARAR